MCKAFLALYYDYKCKNSLFEADLNKPKFNDNNIYH